MMPTSSHPHLTRVGFGSPLPGPVRGHGGHRRLRQHHARQALGQGDQEPRRSRCVLTCEPSTGPIGSLIRQVLQRRLFVPDATGPRNFDWSTMALLFAADRMDHLDSTVVPALRAGSVVISDRYDLSSLAYQSVTAHNGSDPIPWIRQLNAQALRPDLTIVIDVPAEVAEERRRTRGGRRGDVRGARAPSSPGHRLRPGRGARARAIACSTCPASAKWGRSRSRVFETVISAASGFFQAAARAAC